jgi:lipopolysaccharide export system ATP-binding protein
MAVIKKFRIKSFKDQRTALELRKISISFGNREILNNLSLKVNDGQILGMLGPNGVGKSTIFNLITGLVKPKFGEVIISGENATNYPIYERTSKFKIGYVPQHGGYFHEMTTYDNLKSIAEIQIRDTSKRFEKINQIISKFELDPISDVKAKFLSGGQKKKLVIGMALISEPKILLLDEIFAALDVLTIKMLQQIIVNLQTFENISVILCDHQARDLLSCVDKAIVLFNGKIISSGSPMEIVNDKDAKLAYFGDTFKIN